MNLGLSLPHSLLCFVLVSSITCRLYEPNLKMDLWEFLESRGISPDVIQHLRKEKIDADVIPLLSNGELMKYFETEGDCLAVVNFCKRKNTLTSKKDSIIESLKKKIGVKYDNKRRNDSVGEGSPAKRHNSEKDTRKISIGWLMGDDESTSKQVRARTGGGTRAVSVPKTYTKEDILREGLKLFFPDGKSPKGPIEKFHFEVLDFKRNKFPDGMTIMDILNTTKIKDLRVYIKSSERQDYDNDLSLEHSEEPEIEETQNQMPSTYTDDMNQFELPGVATTSDQQDSNISINSEKQESFFEESQHQELLVEATNSAGPSSRYDLDDLLSFEVIQEITTQKVILHRGQVFEELLEVYKNFRFEVNNLQLQIEMIGSNGKPEKGFDSGGIFRDALCEFWQTFFDKTTLGTTYKVPCLRHDFGSKEWRAVAKIMIHGWVTNHYFPIKIAPVFMEISILGFIYTDVVENFLRYLSPADADTITTALNDFPNADINELTDLLEIYESKWLPTADNIEKLVKEIAHKELIQKPMFIIQCWNEEILNRLTLQELQRVYKNAQPETKNVLAAINRPDEVLSTAQEKVFNFLKKFIKECDLNTRSKFLRFCTGSDILTPSLPIYIVFNDQDGLGRTPVGHTCTGHLELSTSYDNFPEFRTEFSNVLDSNLWSIDIL